MINKPTPTTLHSLPFNGLRSNTDRLDSWKEIAVYLRREVRTVQLWEKHEGLPVHRHFHKKLGSVFALRSEIEEWKRQVSREDNICADESPALGAVKGNGQRIKIHVLPLRIMNASSERLRLCDAIAAKTIVALEQLDPGRLEVVRANVSTPQKEKFSAAFADDARAEYMLEWNIQEVADGLRIKAFLHAGTDVIWSHTYCCSSGNFSSVPAYISEQIVQCLWLKIISFQTSGPVSKCPEKLSSREAYLKGRYFWKQRSEESLRKALHCFESAMHQDPGFSLPYSGLSDALTLLSFYEIVSPSEVMPSARRAALKAIELDPNSAEAHTSLADVFLHFDRDWPSADREYRRAIECNPDYALGYHWYANLLAAKGQHDAAHIAIMHALEIDPVSVITLVWAGVTAHLAHQFDEAIKHYQCALELDPDFIWAHMYKAQALEQKGDFTEALKEFEMTNRLAGGSNCVKAMEAHTHAIAGDKSSAREILAELKDACHDQRMPSYDIAATYAALGESHKMVAWLNRACDERNMKLFTLTQDPRFDSFRGRGEFKEIVGQVGLAQYSSARGRSWQ